MPSTLAVSGRGAIILSICVWGRDRGTDYEGQTAGAHLGRVDFPERVAAGSRPPIGERVTRATMKSV